MDINNAENNKNEKSNNQGGNAGLIGIIIGVVIVVLLFACGNSDSGSSDSKYDYITKPDGTRIWYDTTNDHIKVYD